MTRRATAVLLIASAAAISPAGAQNDASSLSSPRNSCLEAIPDSALRRVPVYLTANFADSAGSSLALRSAIDLLTQSVAQVARALLGAEEGVLPAGESAITWRSLTADVVVVVHRPGAIAWRLKPPAVLSDVRANDAGALLVGRALDTVRAREGAMAFPESFAADSLTWILALERATIDEQGEMRTPMMRLGVPVFSVLAPAERQVGDARVRVQYPPRLRNAGFMGRMLMEFLVDTSGRAIPSTIRDLFPAAHPPLAGEQRTAYDGFTRSIRLALESAKFTPARVGGCLVRQMVRQHFTFDLR